MKNKKFKASN